MEIQDTHLVVEIKNKEPLELIDLTKSLVALGNQYASYASKNADSKIDREAKLYVKEIRTGSVILDLYDIARVGAIPFAEHVNTVIEFGKFIGNIGAYFLKKDGEKPQLNEGDYKDLSNIFNPVAKDSGSQVNFITVVNGNVEYKSSFNSVESNALQNLFQSEIKALHIPETLDGDNTKVLFYWNQAKNDLKSDTGNKGIIEKINPSALRVTFESDSIKEAMIKGDTNPFNHGYIVDVEVLTIKNKPVLYKIIKLHEIFDIQELQ